MCFIRIQEDLTGSHDNYTNKVESAILPCDSIIRWQVLEDEDAENPSVRQEAGSNFCTAVPSIVQNSCEILL